MSKFYFTFGSDPSFPYQNGWVEISAKDIRQAIDIFRACFPDRTKGLLNCAFYYTQTEFEQTDMFNQNHARILPTLQAAG